MREHQTGQYPKTITTRFKGEDSIHLLARKGKSEMYIEDIFYSNVGIVRDFVGSGLAVAGILWMVVRGFAVVCRVFGIEAK